ncbi:MAG: oligosaccharide flippase family protein [Candidatus Xenobia bacterium]
MNLKRQIVANTVTNYVRVFVRLASGLITFRLLYQTLPAEQFGYWALLWSLFGYSVLLDFGFGTTAQKEMAHGHATGEWERLSRLISTMLWTFVGLGAVLLLVFIVVEPFFLRSVHISAENWGTFHRAYLIFFGFMALAFPLGIFYETLTGLQRLDIVNWLCISGLIANLVLIVMAAHFHWPFEIFVLIGVATSLLPYIGAAVMTLRLAPRLSLSPRLFSWASVKPMLGFSLTVYLIIFRGVLLSRTDQLTISVFAGVALVAVYQAAFKLTEVFNQLTLQLQEALAPAAAHLQATGDQKLMKNLFIESCRLTTVLTTPVYAVSAVYVDSLLRLLTGVTAIDPRTHQVAEILLFTAWSSLITSSVGNRMMVMCGWERQLLKITMVDGVVKLLLSIALIFQFGIVGVALGTMLPIVIIGWAWMVPVTLRWAQMGFWEWCRETIFKAWMPVAMSLAFLLLTLCIPMTDHHILLQFAPRGLLVMAPVLIHVVERMRHSFWHDPIPLPEPAALTEAGAVVM